MRALLLVALLATTSAAAAPPLCWPDVSLPITVEMADKVATPKVGEVIYAASSVGLVWGYTCIASDGKWYKHIAGGPWTAFPSDWLFQLDKVIRGTDADRLALWNKYATATAWDTRLQPDLDLVWAKLPVQPAAPPPVVWKVLADPFRADKKRVVYTVVNGKRGTATAQYIDAGAPCDPVTTVIEFGPTYFLSVLGNPALVARCVK